MNTLSLLAQYAWHPFTYPLPVWNYWWVLAFPLCIGVSIVYKAIKCPKMKDVPREAAGITMWIVLGMVGAAAVLSGLVKVLER